MPRPHPDPTPSPAPRLAPVAPAKAGPGPLPAEQDPAASAPDSAWLTRGRAARLLAVHVSTIKRHEASGRLRTFRTSTGHVLVSRVDVEALRDAAADSDGDEGERAALVFDLLAEGASPATIVRRLKLAPAVVERLVDAWCRLEGGLYLSAVDLAKIGRVSWLSGVWPPESSADFVGVLADPANEPPAPPAARLSPEEKEAKRRARAARSVAVEALERATDAGRAAHTP